MLVITLVCQKDRDIIEEVNEIKKHFEEKEIHLGISESIYSGTHFVKIFCEDKWCTEKFLNRFYLYIANIIYRYAVSSYYDLDLTNFLNDNCFFLKQEDLLEIEILAMSALRGEQISFEDGGIFYINRKNCMLDKIIQCLKENTEVNIDGFITFRLKELKVDFEAIVEKVMEKYIINKEYNEFIQLLKYFVEMQDSKIDKINIVIDRDGNYKFYDGDSKEIIDQFFIAADIERCGDKNVEDLIISGLITNAPQQVIIHGENYCRNKELIETIKNVFSERFVICSSCELCSKEKSNKKIQ